MPTLNYKESDGTDVGDKGFVTKDYVMNFYPQLAPALVAPELFGWGRNNFGQLGNGVTTSRSSPGTNSLGGTDWKSVACGYGHTIGIKNTGAMWLWGRNESGQLGVGDTTNRSSPVSPAGGGTNWAMASAGFSHTAAIKTDGTLWTWGSNTHGQLGIGSTTARSSPGTITGWTNVWEQNQWKSVSVSGGTAAATLAIKGDGTLWLWGRNNFGQLGDGTTTNRSSPVTTAGGGTNWKQAVCGEECGVAIKTDGTLWTWGRNQAGQLGTGNTTDRSSPGTVAGGGTTWAVAAASKNGYFLTAIKTDGTLWTWGTNNLYGQLGTGDKTDRSSPGTVAGGGTTWKKVSCGDSMVLALKTDGSLWSWGRADYGQLNSGAAVERSSPGMTLPNYRNNWKELSAGMYFGFATTESDGW